MSLTLRPRDSKVFNNHQTDLYVYFLMFMLCLIPSVDKEPLIGYCLCLNSTGMKSQKTASYSLNYQFLPDLDFPDGDWILESSEACHPDKFGLYSADNQGH